MYYSTILERLYHIIKLLSYLCVFGSLSIVHLRLKWDRNSENVKGYRIYSRNNVITTGQDVIILRSIKTENVPEVQKYCCLDFGIFLEHSKTYALFLHKFI